MSHAVAVRAEGNQVCSRVHFSLMLRTEPEVMDLDVGAINYDPLSSVERIQLG